jgi:hypothetical protein
LENNLGCYCAGVCKTGVGQRSLCETPLEVTIDDKTQTEQNCDSWLKKVQSIDVLHSDGSDSLR